MGTYIAPSTAVGTEPDNGVLSSVGDFNSASSLGSNSVAPMVIGDSVTNLTIDTVNATTTATAYSCIEGNFLAGVGANGCANTGLGGNFFNETTVAYNVGGNANCVQRTIGGDDTASEGNVRTLTTTAGGGGCDAGDGAFDLWTVVQDNLGTGGTLIIATSNDITTPGGAYLTFSSAQVVPLPGAIWLLGSALGLVGVRRWRRTA
ncbi:MAG: VPLPA-CTERM sorting domain-containing protein [Gammaproteobacteria bacterium]